MKKQWLSLLLVLVMVLAMAPAVADSAEPFTFTVLAKTWSPYNPDETRVWDALTERTGVKMEFIWAPNTNFTEKVNTTLASGDIPDCIYGADISTLLNQEAIIPLDELIDEYCPNYKALLTEDDYIYLRSVTDGKMYFLTHLLDFAPSYSTLVRQDWLNDANMDAPDTWDEWLDFWTWVLENDANGNGDETDEIPIVMPNTASLLELGTWFDIKVHNSYFATTNDGELVPLYEHENFEEFLDTMIELYNNGMLDKEFATRSDTYKTALDSGVASTTYYYSERARLTTSTLRDSGDEDAAFLFVAPVRYYDGTNGLIKARTKCYTYGLSITVSAAEKGKAEKIMEFFNYVYSDEGSLLLNYGVEGQHCEIVDGKYVYLPDIISGGFTTARASGVIPSLMNYNFLGEAYMQILTGGLSYEELPEPIKYFYDALYFNEPYFYNLVPVLNTEAYVAEGSEHTGKLTSIFAQCVAGELTKDEFYAAYQVIKDEGWQDIIDEQIDAYNLIMG